MKKFFNILIVSSLLLTGCYDDLRDQELSRLDDLKVSISSLQAQMDSISSSIVSINALSAEMDSYITSLQKINEELKSDITALDIALEATRSELESNIDASKAKVLAEFENAKSALETKRDDINKAIEVLKSKKISLEAKLEQIRSHSDSVFATKDWVGATMVNFEFQKALQDSVASIKAYVDVFSESLIATENEIKERLGEKLAGISSTLDSELQTAVNNLAWAYQDAISRTGTEVIDAFEQTLASALSDSEERLKKWVGEQLDQYYPAAEAEAKILALREFIGDIEGDTSIQDEIEALLKEIAKAKKELTEGYESIIKGAIEKSGTDMDKAVLAKINEIKSATAELSGKVDALENEIKDLWTKLNALGSSINTVDEQIGAINKSIAILNALNKTLEEYISGVKAELSKSDSGNFNAVNAKIESLQAVADTLQKQLNSLREYVGTIPEGVSQTNIADWVKASEQTILQQFGLYCTVASIGTYEADINGSIDTIDLRIAGIDAKLKSFLADSKQSIDGWIDERLTSYHTAAVVDQKIGKIRTDLKGLVDASDSDIQKSIDTLDADFKAALGKFAKDYAAAISKAISDNAGVVTDTIRKGTDAAAAEILSLQGRVTTIENDIKAIRGALDTIKADIAGIKGDVGTVRTFIDSSGYESLQAFVTYALGVIDNFGTGYLKLTDFNSLKKQIYGDDLTGTSSGLKFEVAKLAGLTESLETVEEHIAGLGKFFEGYGDTDNLESILDAIVADLEYVKGATGGFDPSEMQSVIDDYLEELYGSNRIPDNPNEEEEDCIWYKIKYVEAKIIACSFRSIAYVPSESGNGAFVIHKEANKWTTHIDFMIRPVELVDIIFKENCHLMVKLMSQEDLVDFNTAFAIGKGDTTYGYQIENKNKADGTFTLTAKLKNGGGIFTPGHLTQCFFVLYFDSFGDDPLGFFTSPYIPILAE